MASTLLRQVGEGTRSRNARRLGTVLRERAWLIFLCVLLGGAVGTLYLSRAPRHYVATTSIKYQSAMSRLLAIFEKDAADPAAQLAEIQRTLVSRDLLRKVAESQRLAEHPRFGAGTPGPAGLEKAVDALLGRLTVRVPANDVVLYISVRDRSPDLAARLANAVVDSLLAEYSRMRAELQSEVSARLQSMLQKVRSELQQEERTASSSSNEPSPAVQRDQQLVTDLRSLSDQLAAAEVRRLELSSELNQAQAQRDPEAALQVGSIASQPNVRAAQQILLNSQVAFEDVTQRYREKHTRYQEARDALEKARQDLRSEITKAVASLAQEVAQAQKARDNLQAQYDAKLAEIRTLTAQPAATTNLVAVRELEIVRQFYDRVIGRLKEFEFGGEVLMAPLQQVQRATPPTQSEGPNPPRVLGLGFLGGLLVGLLFSLVFGYGDTSLRTVDEVEQVLDLPVLGVVPRLKDNETEMAAAEGFRSLRTSIAVSSKGKEPRLLLFTSTSPDEGKTFCALNFAVGLSQQGHRTVLIECDLRRPMAAPSLSMVKVDAPGVSDYLKTTPSRTASPAGTASDRGNLSFAEIRRKKSEDTSQPPPVSPASPAAGSLDLNDIVQQTEVPNLFFVAAGRPVAQPTELLSRPRFEDLLNQLLQHYDRVVLDSAPVLGVSETLLLASRVQGVCFIIRGNQTPRRAVQRAIEILRRAEVPLMGAVLNGVTPGRSDPYGQDYYYHRTQDRTSAS